MPHAVDVEGRCPVDAASHPAHEVLADARCVHVLGQLFVEALDVEPEVLRVAAEVRSREARLVFVEQVVHLPEPALGGRALGALRGLFGMRVRRRDREVPKHEPEPITQPRLNFLDDGIRRTAVRTLVVAVLDERHRRTRRSLNVVPLVADRHRQCGAKLGRAHVASFPRFSSARRIPSAPGFTPTGDT